jgi:hypothetical protein
MPPSSADIRMGHTVGLGHPNHDASCEPSPYRGSMYKKYSLSMSVFADRPKLGNCSSLGKFIYVYCIYMH